MRTTTGGGPATTPEGWEKAPIRSVLAQQFAGEWGSDPTPGKANVGVLRSTNLEEGGKIDFTRAAWRFVDPAKVREKRLIEGDLLLEGSGGGPGTPVGRVAYFTDPDSRSYVCSNFFRTLRPSDAVHPRFLFWRLHHLYEQPAIWRFQQQTTSIVNLKRGDYLDHEIHWPPLPEQRRIAEILDTVDQAIRHTEAIIAKLEQVKAGLLHDLLTRGLDENGELRDPERHPEQFRDSPLGQIPREWEVRQLPEVAQTYAGGTPSRSRPELFRGDVPWVKSSEVNAAEIWATEETVTRAGLESSSAKMVPAGTPLIAMYGATAGAVTWLAVPACTNQAVLAAVPQSDVIGRWLYWALLRSSGRLLASVQGSGQPNLSKTQIDRLALAVPAQHEQESIKRILDAHRRRSASERSELEKLRKLKVGLMQDLLTGTVRVGVPEAASAGGA